MLNNTSFWLALLIAAIFLACSVVLRGTTHGSWELKLTDAALALLPIFIWLVFSGQLKELKIGSEGFSAAFQDAASASIDQAVEKLPVEALVADEKTLLPDIPKFIERRDRALIFILGKQYVPSIAKEYVKKLTEYDFFEFIMIQQNGGAFFGLIDARKLSVYLATDSDWARFINAISQVDQAYFGTLPGFVGASAAVADTAPNAAVLQRMEDLHLNWLPVTGSDSKLVGVVQRSGVLARLVLDLNGRLRK